MMIINDRSSNVWFKSVVEHPPPRPYHCFRGKIGDMHRVGKKYPGIAPRVGNKYPVISPGLGTEDL